jgi:Uma2 family endonuclease
MSTIMPTQSMESPNLSDWIPSPLFRMTLERYEEMVESGAFTEHDRVHLINGFLVAKMTQGDPHCVSDDLCRNAITGVLPRGWFVRSDKPVRLPPDGKPEPGHAVARGEIRDYTDHSPGPADIALIVEVALSSVAEDRIQANVYAAAGIPVYWIVNLVERQIEVYSGPSTAGYSSRVDFLEGQNVPVVIAGQAVGQIVVADVLP